jgi:rhomboid family protein
VNNYYKPAGFGGFSLFPPVIKNLIIINCAVFIIQELGQYVYLAGVPLENYILRWFGLWTIGSGFFEVWQLISYQFMHGGFLHILFNMFILWMFGIEIENLWGSRKFLTFYLTAGVVGGLSQIIFYPLLVGGPIGPTIGASAAIMGVMVAFGILFPNRLIYLYFLIPIKTKYFVIFLILIDFLYIGSQSIANLAHIGGAAAGLIYMLYEKKKGTAYGNYFNSSYGSSSGQSMFSKMSENLSGMFKKKEKNVEDAKFYEIKKEDEEKVDQAEIDKILDKISESGYQNLTEREKKILFEASKKMK